MANPPIRQRRSRRRQLILAVFALVLLLLAVPSIWLWLVFERSAPQLEGTHSLPGLMASVEIARDGQGVATVTAENRLDLARTLGFLHGQERFFQMDLLRRVGGGELSALAGTAALPTDRAHRLHRFRARAEAILGRMPSGQQALIKAYTDGVNAGLAALQHVPFEYALLRAKPVAWQAADTLLVIYAMYFDLQDSTGWRQERKSVATKALGAPLADFLYPAGTPADVPLDGSVLPEPPIPGVALPPPPASEVERPDPPPPPHGSNAFAVSGTLSNTGSAIVANDMHLGLRVPDIWYRVRMRIVSAGQADIDLDGVTLPGTPMLVTGSNGHVVWGFTDSYIRSGDLVLLDPVPGQADEYSSPSGPRALERLVEQICPIRAPCENLTVEESIWGPVVGTDSEGRKLVWRWAAHDANAIDLTGMLALETAGSVREALDAAHHAGMPQQNFVVGDRDGHIAWSIIGQVPRRVALDDEPRSWADGTRGWEGYLQPSEIPEIIDPPDGRIWTANNRIVGGDQLATLGDGGYAEAGRARQISDDLKRQEHFTERDLLAIELDTHTAALDGWQQLLLHLLQDRGADAMAASMRPLVENWGGAAVANSVGYRLVRTFQEHAVRLIYGGLCAPIKQRTGTFVGSVIGEQSIWPSLRLLLAKPGDLVPPPYSDWTAVEDALVKAVEDDVGHYAGGDLARFTWGARNMLGIHHPLSAFVPLLGLLTDPRDRPIDGDALPPHVSTPGFGASERMVISPGHEEDAIFEMPGGNSGSPMTPYYLAGTKAWVGGDITPFLPGLPRWRLTLRPD